MHNINFLYFSVLNILTFAFFAVIITVGDYMDQDFIITGIGRVIFVGKNEYPGKKIQFDGPLSYNELIYHFNGKSTVRFNGKVLYVEENTIRFLPKGENKEYIVEKESPGECIDVFFDTNIPISNEASIIKICENTIIANFFKKIFAVWVSKNEGYYFECISLLYRILAEMQKQKYISKNQYNAIKPAIEYIEENFRGSKISVSYLANKCGISEDYLKKLFIKKFGMAPKKYIIQLKINHACDLLRAERYSITQVADLCGYEDVYYFSRQFKKYIGVTPSVFEKRYKSSK